VSICWWPLDWVRTCPPPPLFPHRLPGQRGNDAGLGSLDSLPQPILLRV
jgi:hypothetical protein